MKIPKSDSPLYPVLTGILLRLIHIGLISSSPVLKIPVIDAEFYHQWAQGIASGRVMGEGVFFMSPLYPYLMGFLYALFGPHPLIIVLFQVCLSGLTVWMIWSLARRIGGKNAGIVAGWAGAVLPVWIYFDGMILTASLILFLNTCALYILVKWSEKGKPGLIFLAGALLGLSALARPNILLFGFILVLWLIFKRRLYPALLLICGILIAVSPATLRNYILTGEFALTTASGGMNFYIGNSEYATGLYIQPDFVRSAEPQYEFEDYQKEAEAFSWTKLNSTQTSRFWYKAGALFLISNPLKAGELWWKKFFYFWDNLEAPDNLSIYFVKRYSPIIRYLFWGFGLLATLGLTGLIFSPNSQIKTLLWLYLLSLLLSNLLYFTSSEFRFPAVTALLIGLGLLYNKIKEAVKLRHWNWKLLTVVFFLFIFTHFETGEALKLKSPRMDYFNLGSVCLKKGDWKAAVGFFESSLKEDPSFADGHMGLGTALIELGEYESAAAEFQILGYKVTPDDLKQKYSAKP